METTPSAKEDVLMKLISQASDGLVLDVYARIEADRRRVRAPGSTGPGAVKTWAELVDVAVREGALTAEEGALLRLGTGLEFD